MAERKKKKEGGGGRARKNAYPTVCQVLEKG